MVSEAVSKLGKYFYSNSSSNSNIKFSYAINNNYHWTGLLLKLGEVSTMILWSTIHNSQPFIKERSAIAAYSV